MSIDTYVVIPTSKPAKLAEALDSEGHCQVGGDYVALHIGQPYAEVEREPERFGLQIVGRLPAWARRELDPRGLAAYPDVGQAFELATHAQVIAAEAPALWLPVAHSTKPKRRLHVLFVSLSAERERLLLADPELVPQLIDARTSGIPGSLELDQEIESLQQALQHAARAADDDIELACVLAPRGGMPLYEDDTVQDARLLRADRCRASATWLASLPTDAASLESLLRPSRARRETVLTTLETLRSFFAGVAALQKSLLVVRFLA